MPKEASYTVEWYDAGTGNLLPDEVKAVNPETRTGEIGSEVEVLCRLLLVNMFKAVSHILFYHILCLVLC